MPEMPYHSHEEKRIQLSIGNASLEEPTAEILDCVGLAPGMKCLDVGCGTGGAMKLMGERVGLSGRVTGLDIRGDLGRRVTAALQATGVSRFEFIEGRAEEVTCLLPESYDLVFALCLLISLTDPVGMVRRMAGWTKPGGHLVLMDYDLRTLEAYPQHELIKEFYRVLLGNIDAMNRDPRVGYHLPKYLEEAGLGPPDKLKMTNIVTRLSEATGFMTSIYRHLIPLSIQNKLTTKDETKNYLHRLADVSREDPTYFFGPLVVGIVKRKTSR